MFKNRQQGQVSEHLKKKQIKPIEDNKQLSLNLPELIRLRTSVWAQLNKKHHFLIE